MTAFILILSKIWGFIKKNPGLIIAIVLGGILIGFIVSYQNKKKQITFLEIQITEFQKDTTARGRDVYQLRSDTAFYLSKLRDASVQLKAFKAYDKKNNPNLLEEFPDINTLKPPKK